MQQMHYQEFHMDQMVNYWLSLSSNRFGCRNFKTATLQMLHLRSFYLNWQFPPPKIISPCLKASLDIKEKSGWGMTQNCNKKLLVLCIPVPLVDIPVYWLLIPELRSISTSHT